uniref:Uncharacterized protein n=1 Tax=Arundo donax TaxID=35708 RepID=A0A0A9FTK3_ARUDO
MMSIASLKSSGSN